MSKKPAPPKPITDPDLVDAIFAWIVERHPEMRQKAPALMEDVRAEFGASYTYVRRQSQTARQQRVSQVLALFNGRNATEVARKLHISRATVYRLLKQPRG